MNYSKPEEVGKLDEVVEEKGVRVVVDSKALMFIVGTEMDYVDNEIKTEFVFNNPNAKGDSCNLVQHGVHISRPSWGVPSFPNYRLGALPGSPCDTINGLIEAQRAANFPAWFLVSPSPS